MRCHVILGEGSNCHKFLYCAICLIDSNIRVCRGARIGVGDGDSAELLPANCIRALCFRPVRIKKCAVFIPVPMRPAIDRNRLNIFRRFKTAWAEDTRKLVARLALEIFKRGHQQFHAPGFVLFASRKARPCRVSGDFARFSKVALRCYQSTEFATSDKVLHYRHKKAAGPCFCEPWNRERCWLKFVRYSASATTGSRDGIGLGISRRIRING